MPMAFAIPTVAFTVGMHARDSQALLQRWNSLLGTEMSMAFAIPTVTFTVGYARAGFTNFPSAVKVTVGD